MISLWSGSHGRDIDYRRWILNVLMLLMVPTALLSLSLSTVAADSRQWAHEWPHTDFSRHSVVLDEIRSGGPPKDGIPAIDDPKFEQLSNGQAQGWAGTLTDKEPVISLVRGDDARAYPLRVLIWHEIVNDVVGGMPVIVTCCPLCNSSLVYQRMIEARVFDFGTTGKLRNSDLVMYDRQTESWWQQFTGEAIVGEMTGHQLSLVPSRLESFERFRQQFPGGKVLIPNNPAARSYGTNPYVGYDGAGQIPFLYDGSLPEGIDPMERVVAVETSPGRHEAWSLVLLREKRRIENGDIILTWEAGQNSSLDTRSIAEGRDIGNVMVQRRRDGTLIDYPFDVTFAFAFHAFRSGSPIHKTSGPSQ
jgi:hypothetical protein